MAGVLASITWPAGKVNPSGIGSRIFFIPKEDVSVFPKLAAVQAAPGDNVTAVGDFTLKAGKTFFELYSTQGKGNISFDAVGEKDHQVFINKGLFSFPDLSKEALALAKYALNSNMIYVVATRDGDGQTVYSLLGDEYWDTMSKNTGNSGAKAGDEKGVTFEIEVTSETPLPRYEGILLLANGSLDTATGVFTETPAGP